ncbi:uncharacterized protein CTRU02_212774 [Colletotrichum truncatum]|uniref:Uncharacterized protein n=1 Tax=Colletotrichum truncatum TaxID=5467 RepID=A0ACC3YJD1_COLTU|nr:uncharacterized protein CTRU02_05146 [Colletotrichum truncatum]KAF6794315.1 hypothetical protein CTRU02_05146 [Colletotrichum truncatum]
MSTMVTVTITYRQPGTQPPIFVAGSFSDPQWEPQEMQFTTEEGGEHTFFKTVEVLPSSQIQYKFRVGLGDWWVLNEDAATVTDDAGNRNNLLNAPASQESTQVNGTKSNGQDTNEENTASSTNIANMDASTTQLDPKPKPLEHLKDEERKRLSSTPIEQVANTAAEVADTAEKLDAEDDTARLAPLNRLKDEERKRLSSTPIEQVAKTAAEVADTAQKLDADQDFDKDLTDDGPPPLFTHEALGPYEPPDDEDDIDETDHHGTVDYDVDKYDLNDPALERLPSNRDGIMEAVRKVETGRNEDQTCFHGAPLSPVVNSRRASIEPQEDVLLSPGLPSPGYSKNLELPRKSHGSMASDRSLVSLGSIAEEEGRDTPSADVADREDAGPVRVPSPAVRPTPNIYTFPASDEDEGVVLKGSTSKSKKSAESSRSDSPDINGNTNGKLSGNISPKTQVPKPDSPSINVQAPEEAGEPSSSDATTPGVTASEASTSGRDAGHKGQLKKRGGSSSADRPGTPSSIHSVADRKGGWLHAFFRVLFVDWIGGLFSRLFGSKRKV